MGLLPGCGSSCTFLFKVPLWGRGDLPRLLCLRSLGVVPVHLPWTWAGPHLERFTCWQHLFLICKKMPCQGSLEAPVGIAGREAVILVTSLGSAEPTGWRKAVEAFPRRFSGGLCLSPSAFCTNNLPPFFGALEGVHTRASPRSAVYWQLQAAPKEPGTMLNEATGNSFPSRTTRKPEGGEVWTRIVHFCVGCVSPTEMLQTCQATASRKAQY